MVPVKHKFLLPLLFAGAITAIAFAISGEPHDFLKNECGYCHIDVQTSPKAINPDVTAGCEKCHTEYSKTQSHPTDIYPMLSTPDDMPLTDGKLTCITCHYVHIDNNVQRNKKHYFLRRQIRGIVFCSACHIIDDKKHIVFESVHKKGYQEKDRSTRIDRMSLECIECHDSYVADIKEILGAGSWNHFNKEYNHPIGASYRKAIARKSRSFRPVSMLNKEMKLYDGKIGCGTCHNIYSKEKAMLIMNNRGSKLCLECHIK
jgi:predicted CXXCH cytochrome family protein